MLRMLSDGDMTVQRFATALGPSGWCRKSGLDPRNSPEKGTMPSRVTLREVSLREGLQCFAGTLPVAFRCDWILIAYAAGLRHIAIGACPAPEGLRADQTLEVAAFAATLPDLQVCVAVQDAESARRALDHGVNVVTVAM